MKYSELGAITSRMILKINCVTASTKAEVEKFISV